MAHILRSKIPTLTLATAAVISSHSLTKPSFSEELIKVCETTLHNPVVNGRQVDLTEVERLSLDINKKFDKLENQMKIYDKFTTNQIDRRTEEINNRLTGVSVVGFFHLAIMSIIVAVLTNK